MKKVWKALIAVILILLVVFAAVFGLAKAKKLFINKWFVNEKTSTIGVDLSSYQADVDMNALRDQGIAFVYKKATEGSTHRDERFPENWAHAREAGLPSGAYHFFSYDSPGATQAENYIETDRPELTGRLLTVVDVE